jgi:hypothetical protein
MDHKVDIIDKRYLSAALNPGYEGWKVSFDQIQKKLQVLLTIGLKRTVSDNWQRSTPFLGEMQ